MDTKHGCGEVEHELEDKYNGSMRAMGDEKLEDAGPS